MAKKVNVDVLDVLDSTEKKDSSSSKVPALDGYEKKADVLSGLLSEYEEMTSKLDLIKEQLVSELRDIYLGRADTNQFVKSFNLPGVQTPGVQVTFTDQFSAIDMKHHADLQKVLGNKFDDFFQVTVGVSVKDQSLESVKKLIGVMGKENFEKFFETKRSIKAVKGMEQKQVDLPKAAQAMLKQYSPQFKRIKQ